MRRTHLTADAAALAAGLLLCGCGVLAPTGNPMLVAHRAGAGNWPENSRTAVRGSVAANYPAIEFDLVLTKDRTPVLSHDPSLSTTLCTRADGSALLAEPVYLKDLTLAELWGGYRCGGVPDPASPSAQVVADTHLSLDELLNEVSTRPGMLLHLDVKFEPGHTLDAEIFADEIIDRMRAPWVQNPWYMSSAQPEFIQAARARGAPVSYTLPRNFPGLGSTASAVVDEVLGKMGVADLIGLARQTGATGLDLAYQIADRAVVDAARREGLSVQIWTLNEAALLEQYCRWPVDQVITDYPERAPCL
jgi:glycerophosphoryl diester phosphodiesterase